MASEVYIYISYNIYFCFPKLLTSVLQNVANQVCEIFSILFTSQRIYFLQEAH